MRATHGAVSEEGTPDDLPEGVCAHESLSGPCQAFFYTERQENAGSLHQALGSCADQDILRRDSHLVPQGHQEEAEDQVRGRGSVYGLLKPRVILAEPPNRVRLDRDNNWTTHSHDQREYSIQGCRSATCVQLLIQVVFVLGRRGRPNTDNAAKHQRHSD